MSKSLDRLLLLQTFVRIADAGSISAAARSMGLSQPSVSRQLAELETRFKAQLIRRTTHDLALTETGTELLADARQLLDEWEALAEKYRNDGSTLKGKLKVVVPIALGQLNLLDTVIQFQNEHPAISVSWQLEDQSIRFAEIGCDCWVKIGPVPDDSLVIEPLGQVERLVVAAPRLLKCYDQLQTPTDIEKLPCIALEPFEGRRIPLTNQQGQSVTICPTARMTTNNIFALRAATRSGLGLAVMPRWLVEDDLQHQRLIDCLPQWRAPQLTIHVASLPGRYQTQRLQSFLKVLRTAVPEIPGMTSMATIF